MNLQGTNPAFQAGQWHNLIWFARQMILVGMNMMDWKFTSEYMDLVVPKTPSYNHKIYFTLYNQIKDILTECCGKI